MPFFGALLGVVAVIRSAKGTRSREVATAAIIVGFLLVVLQMPLVSLSLKAWQQHKRCFILEPLDKLAELSEAYALQHRQSGVPVFPTAQTDWTPQVTGCGRVPVAEQWTAPPWRLIGFSLDQTRYHIQFKYENDGKSLRVICRSDLNCDGLYSLWERKIGVTPTGGFTNRGPFVSGDPNDWK